MSLGRRGAVEGSVLLYIILIVVGAFILIIILQIFTPYKITDLFKPLFSASGIDINHII